MIAYRLRQRLHEQSVLVVFTLEHVDHRPSIDVPAPLVETECPVIAAPSSEPYDIRAGAGLLRFDLPEQCSSHALRRESWLYIETHDLDREIRLYRRVRVAAGDVNVTNQMIVPLREENRCRSLAHLVLERILREELGDLARNRFADAVGRIGVDKNMRGEDAEAQRICTRRAPDLQRIFAAQGIPAPTVFRTGIPAASKSSRQNTLTPTKSGVTRLR